MTNVATINPEAIKQRLQKVFQDVFDDETMQIHERMTAAEVADWDSLSHINLVVAVEKEFRVRLTTAEVRGLNHVGDFIALLSSKPVPFRRFLVVPRNAFPHFVHHAQGELGEREPLPSCRSIQPPRFLIVLWNTPPKGVH